jgi:PAS domain S-box-containing protein
MSGDKNRAQSFTMPAWASESDRYRIQVRELAEYAMFMLDADGILVSWNEGVGRILGYSEDEWVGQHACIIFTPADLGREICVAEMKIAVERGSASDVRWHVRKDGSLLFGNGCMTALYDSSGSLLGFSKIFSDETHSKQVQDKLTASNEALEQFAYVASHDLQEPLRTVTSFADLLARRYGSQLDSDGNKFLDLIRKGANHMNALVKDLLTYARVRTEEDRPSSYSLDQDVETAISQLQGAIEEGGATVTHDPLPEVVADQGQMVRLFQNLIGNALKYRKKDAPCAVHVSAERAGSEWIIRVKDNGIGFEPKHAKEIFKPFKRLHARGEYAGTGVGLAICQRIVENHRGRIWAEPVAGEGTTFLFTIPVEGKEPAKHTSPVSAGL